MENLRVLTADRIRAFHKEMYQPKNLCLVLVGEVDEDHLLQILDDFEDGVLDDIPKPSAPFKRYGDFNFAHFLTDHPNLFSSPKRISS